MGRVKIQFPAYNPLYIATIPVRIGDINYGNHVGNDSILSVIHEARIQTLRNYGLAELSDTGTGMIMADVMIAYRAEAFYGDILSVKVYADEITTNSFSLLYHISTDRAGRTIDVAHGKTGMVCFDYKTRKIAAMPAEIDNFLRTNQH